MLCFQVHFLQRGEEMAGKQSVQLEDKQGTVSGSNDVTKRFGNFYCNPFSLIHIKHKT